MPIENNSAAYQEILGAMPPWILRFGGPMIALAVAFLFLGAWVVRYPKVIGARIEVTTPDPPVRVVAPASGPLRWHVKEGDPVDTGALLAWVQGRGRYEDVVAAILAWEEVLARVSEESWPLTGHPEWHLGTLQPKLAELVHAYQEYRDFRGSDYFDSSIRLGRQEVEKYSALMVQERRNVELLEREVDLAKRGHETARLLQENELASERDSVTAEMSFLASKRSLEAARTRVIQAEIQGNQQQRKIVELLRTQEQEFQRVQRSLNLAAQRFFAAARLALDEHALRAPVAGTVSFTQGWADHHFVTKNEEVLTVVPEGPVQRFVGRLALPRPGSGQVRVGQSVRVKFDGFPFHEFGAVRGRVEEIARVAQEDEYCVKVAFPQGLQTSTGLDLTYRPEMQGDAEIVTADRRILERIFATVWRFLDDTSG